MQQVNPVSPCTIGIPAYNEEKTLPVVLTSLDAQEFPADWKFRLLIVANGCIDATVKIALDFGYEKCDELYAEEADGEIHWWHFHGKRYDFSVCEVSTASRNYALNVIHKYSQSDIILLFDADVQVGAGVVKAMCKAFQENPEHGAVASNFIGEIAPKDPSEAWLAEYCRIWISRAMNNFDRFGVRIDGRGYGYRRSLINEHPKVIAVDLWLEGIAWQRTQGCVYLKDVYVRYGFPHNFREFVLQHKRYVKTISDLSKAYPHHLDLIYNGRRRVQGYSRKPYIFYRCLGWLFFTWLALSTRTSTYREGEPWEVIRSTKA